jgi:hypothetical protein
MQAWHFHAQFPPQTINIHFVVFKLDTVEARVALLSETSKIIFKFPAV